MPLVLSLPGLQNFERVDLNNGLRTFVGKTQRAALFSEVLLVVHAGTDAPANREDEVARVAADAFLSGRRAEGTSSIGLELARLGVTPDFTVGRDVAVFRFAVPTVNTESFLHLLAELLNRPIFSEEEWSEAVARSGQELTDEQTDPWQHSTVELTSLVWRQQVPADAGAHPPSPISRSALARFWEQAYAPANMILSVWGELPVDELARTVRREFGGLAPRSSPLPPSLPINPVLNKTGTTHCLQQEGAVPAALLVGAGARIDSDRDFYAWQLAVHILGASYNSRLQKRLRTESQVVYTVEAAGLPVGTNGMILRIACQTDQVETTRQIILEELRRLTRESVTQQELDLARAILRSRLKLVAASFRDQFFRRSLALLLPQTVRDPAGAEPILAAFTRATLLHVLSSTLQAEAASTVVVSDHSESLCGSSHEIRP
ncbi:MAG: insulinase family protein [Candidatus Sulfotelmatobacter sp.]